jgi:hypothetical protein
MGNEIELFGKKSKCLKCAKKFGNETELMEHNRAAHATYDSILSTKVIFFLFSDFTIAG